MLCIPCTKFPLLCTWVAYAASKPNGGLTPTARLRNHLHKRHALSLGFPLGRDFAGAMALCEVVRHLMRPVVVRPGEWHARAVGPRRTVDQVGFAARVALAATVAETDLYGRA